MDTKLTSRKYIGEGWSFPPTFSKAAGTVMTSTGVDEIQESLSILLSTRLGERVMHPDYGSSMDDLLFEPVDTSLQTLIVDRIEKAILYFEPRIELNNVELLTDQITEGILLLEVEYTIRATNSRFNFVYPFYKNEGSENALR